MAIVARERPGGAFLGEERGETGDGPRRWIVDAIDGTVSFAQSSTGWGTLLALEIDGHIAVGICEMSPTGKRYWATRGGGAYVSTGGEPGVRLAVSDVEEAGGRLTDLAGGPTLTGGAVFSNGRLHDAALEVLGRASGAR
jgi:histidinol-phosphatase